MEKLFTYAFCFLGAVFILLSAYIGLVSAEVLGTSDDMKFISEGIIAGIMPTFFAIMGALLIIFGLVSSELWSAPENDDMADICNTEGGQDE